MKKILMKYFKLTNSLQSQFEVIFFPLQHKLISYILLTFSLVFIICLGPTLFQALLNVYLFLNNFFVCFNEKQLH